MTITRVGILMFCLVLKKTKHEPKFNRFYKSVTEHASSTTKTDQNQTLNGRPCPDAWQWHYTKTGTYTVKSGYKLEAIMNTNQTSSSHPVLASAFWKNLWNLEIPQKIKIFTWRCCRDVIPTALNLSRKKVISSPKCNLCGSQTEDGAHALLWCENAKVTWKQSQFWKTVCYHKSSSSLIDILSSIDSEFGREEQALFCCILWAIWVDRNRLMHGESLQGRHNRLTVTKIYIDEFKSASSPNCNKQPSSCGPASGEWTPPPPHKLKINTDAAFKTGENEVGLGIAIRNHVGDIVAAKYCWIKGPSTVILAEALALREGLRWAKEENILIDYAEIDAQNICSRVNSNQTLCDSLDIVI